MPAITEEMEQRLDAELAQVVQRRLAEPIAWVEDPETMPWQRIWEIAYPARYFASATADHRFSRSKQPGDAFWGSVVGGMALGSRLPVYAAAATAADWYGDLDLDVAACRDELLIKMHSIVGSQGASAFKEGLLYVRQSEIAYRRRRASAIAAAAKKIAMRMTHQWWGRGEH